MREYFLNIYLGISTILIGMTVTFRHLFTSSVTVQYPHQKLDLPKRDSNPYISIGSRNLLVNRIDDCIGCDKCARACPVDCIEIETILEFKDDDLGLTSQGTKKRLWVPTFNIDMAKCCYCGLCVYPCPTECLFMTDEYEYSKHDRFGLIYKWSDVSPEKAAELREKDRIRKKEKEAKKAAATEAKAAASGPGRGQSLENKQ